MTEIPNWLPYLNSGGVLGLLIVIVMGGARGWWYYGRTYDAKAAECEEWKKLALGSVDTIQEAIAVMEPIIERLGR